MSTSSIRIIFLSIIVIMSLVFTIPNVHAELEITAISSGTTTILTVSTDDESVDTLRMWLGSGTTFESFKGERGWAGNITPQGVLIFSTNEPIISGDSVKFGFKTSTVKPPINWRALDGTTEIGLGVVLPQDLSSIYETQPVEPNQNIPPVVSDPTPDPSDPIQSDPTPTDPTPTPDPVLPVKSEPTFRIIPDRPSVGTSIRVVGENFGESESLDFYINSQNLGSFETNSDGTFVSTVKIPDDQVPDRVDFKVVTSTGEEKIISVRINPYVERVFPVDDDNLELYEIPDSIRQGDSLELSGTAKPNTAVVAEITSKDGRIINARTTSVDESGLWNFGDDLSIPFDALLGNYDLLLSDGRDRITQQFEVITHKIIVLESTKRVFTQGDMITVNITALPNIPIDILLEDSLGNEREALSLGVDQSGKTQFEYQSLADIDNVGTWKLTATQSDNKELLYIGYGQPPITPVTIEFDKLNHDHLDPVDVHIMGRANEKVTMLIIGPTGKAEGDPIDIQIGPDGTATHTLDISKLKTGIYNAVINKGSTQSNARFTVGLQVGAGEISASPTKLQYIPGESILILGNSKPNILLTAALIDPNDTEIKKIYMPSDSEGNFNGEGLRIPSHGSVGQWKIRIASGSNFESVIIDVVSIDNKGIKVSVDESDESLSFGKLLNINIEGVTPESIVAVVITDINETVINDQLKCTASESRCTVQWIVNKEIEVGLYTITATNGSETASTTYEKTE